MRVIDSAGASGETQQVIFVGHKYDEVEDNDSPETAQTLPPLFSNFEGSHSTGPGYAGYDGDGEDYFNMPGQHPGEHVQLECDYTNTTGEMSLDILDGGDQHVAFSDGTAGKVTLDYVLGSADSGGPYVIEVWDTTGQHYGDYKLNGHFYSEVEDNDSQATAQTLPAFPINEFYGSQGTGAGYPGYDGDQNDYFKLNGGSAGQTLNVNLFYFQTGGEMSVDLFDGGGHQLAFHDGAGGISSLTYVLGSNVNDFGGPYILRIWDINNTHYSDYSLDATLN